MLPVFAAAIGLSSAVGGIYGIRQAGENYRYWSDYYRNTGRRPRYPYRSGYYNYGQLASSVGRFGFAGAMMGRSPSYGYAPYDRGYMYW